jgi:hypothetical protein
MYQIYDEFVFFNTSDVYYLPGFEVHPGATTHPYVGPNGEVSLLIYDFGDEVPLPFNILTDSLEITYVGENLTEIILCGPDPVLQPGDLPCILAGLSAGDLPRIEAWAIIEETRYLLTSYDILGLSPLQGSAEALTDAISDFEEGRYNKSVSTLSDIKETMLTHGLDAIWPMVEEGFANPRDSDIPLDILRLFGYAESLFSRGDSRRGELYFIRGLEEIKAIPEMTTATTSILIVLSIPFLIRRRNWESNHISNLIQG